MIVHRTRDKFNIRFGAKRNPAAIAYSTPSNRGAKHVAPSAQDVTHGTIKQCTHIARNRKCVTRASVKVGRGVRQQGRDFTATISAQAVKATRDNADCLVYLLHNTVGYPAIGLRVRAARVGGEAAGGRGWEGRSDLP